MQEAIGRTEHFDVIVVGAGTAGVVCAAILASRGAHVLLVSETVNAGHQARSRAIGRHLAMVQQPIWHHAGGGGYLARVIRELGLKTQVHASAPMATSVRGDLSRHRLPIMCSGSHLSDLMRRLLLVPSEVLDQVDIERVLDAGLAIPWEQLCQMHGMTFEDWLDDQKADQSTRLGIELVVGAITGIPASGIGKNFSAFGALAPIRTILGSEGARVMLTPDVQRGFVEPLNEYVDNHGGETWRSVVVDSVIVENGVACGVRMADSRQAIAKHVAIAVGNERIPPLFVNTPAELIEPLASSHQQSHEQITVATLLKWPAATVTGTLLIHDRRTGANILFEPLSVVAPWNSPDDRQLCLQSFGGLHMTHPQAVDYLDDVCEDEFPGWRSALEKRRSVVRQYDWTRGCRPGPKVPRRSTTIDCLWYVGADTEPLGGIGTEQAVFAGYDGATAILQSGC